MVSARNALSLKTTVRTFLMRAAMRVFGTLTPSLAARWLDDVFLRTRRREVPEREREWLASARSIDFTSRSQTLSAQAWGTAPSRRVLLVHGWEGRGSQMAAFVAPLVQQGATVISFDAPGHGASPGTHSSLIEMADAVIDANDQLGPFDAVIAHSAGAAATTIALSRTLSLDKAVYVSPPADLGAFLHKVSDFLGLPRKVADRTRRRIEERFGVRWDSLRLSDLAPKMRTDLLVIHDRDDLEVEFENGQRVAELWPQGRLHVSEGLGHRRILRDPQIVSVATDFLAFRRDRSEASDVRQPSLN